MSSTAAPESRPVVPPPAPAGSTAKHTGTRRRSSPVAVVIVTLLVIGALRAGEVVVLPIVIALLLTLLLSAPVRWLHQKGVPDRVAAAIVVFGALAVGVGATLMLVPPAVAWVESAPETVQRLETRVRQLATPVMRFMRSADRMQEAAGPAAPDAPRTVQLATPSIISRLSVESVVLVPISLTIVFLTYFLLANGPLFRRKLAALLPGRHELKRRERLLAAIELAASRFLITVTVVNGCVGLFTALALWAAGVPSPFVWGAFVAALNFVPYLGPVVTAPILGLAALASIDDPVRALFAPLAFLGIHLVEANFVTPMLLGRHLPLNAAAIVVGVLFFGWMWGIPGAVLAVPLTVCTKLICDQVPSLAQVGALLDT